MNLMEQNTTPPTPTPHSHAWLTTVTPLSKALALFLFISLPFVGFYLGVLYEKQLAVSTTPTVVIYRPTAAVVPTQLPVSITPTSRH